MWIILWTKKRLCDVSFSRMTANHSSINSKQAGSCFWWNQGELLQKSSEEDLYLQRCLHLADGVTRYTTRHRDRVHAGITLHMMHDQWTRSCLSSRTDIKKVQALLRKNGSSLDNKIKMQCIFRCVIAICITHYTSTERYVFWTTV